jgi:hypothetical protein
VESCNRVRSGKKGRNESSQKELRSLPPGWLRFPKYRRFLEDAIRLFGQLEAAVVSRAVNSVEGKGRFSKKRIHPALLYCQGFTLSMCDSSRLFRMNLWSDPTEFGSLKSEGLEIAAMIRGLINSLRKSLRFWFGMVFFVRWSFTFALISPFELSVMSFELY